MDGLYSLLNTLFPFEFMSLTFMKNAFLAVILLTPLLGLMGTMAVNQRMAFFSDALGHSALTGIGLGIVLGVSSELISMLVFGILWALLISRLKQKSRASVDTLISVFSSTSVALGLVILSQGGGFARYSSLLVGDVLAVTPQDLGWLLIALILGVGGWVFLFNPLMMTSVNPALARSRGIRARLCEYAFVIMLALAVMLAIRWVGVMLINALLIVPAAAGRNLARTSRGHAFWSMGIALFSGISGLIAAFYLNTSAGAAIVLAASLFYGISLGAKFLMEHRKGVSHD